jgi:hypothetical protein
VVQARYEEKSDSPLESFTRYQSPRGVDLRPQRNSCSQRSNDIIICKPDELRKNQATRHILGGLAPIFRH